MIELLFTLPLNWHKWYKYQQDSYDIEYVTLLNKLVR